MRFSCTTEINLPITKVVELFENTDNLKYWQQGLQSYEQLSGTAGDPGAKARIVIHQGKHVIELIETVITNRLPYESSALYEHRHMINTMTNRFSSINAHKTKYETEIHYTKFIGFIPKMMALLMPGMFKRQVQKTIDRFKTFAEKHI